MDVALLVASVVAAIAAVVAAVAGLGAWRVGHGAKSAAEHSNHLAARPDVTLECDGSVERGLEVDLTSNRDLTSIHLALQRNPSHSRDIRDMATLVRIFMDGLDQQPRLDADGRGVTIPEIEAGRRYHFSVLMHGAPTHARAEFKVTATDGDEKWIFSRSIPTVELRYPSF